MLGWRGAELSGLMGLAMAAPAGPAPTAARLSSYAPCRFRRTSPMPLLPRPTAEPEGDSLAPLPPADADRLGPLPAVPHFAVASSSVASVCGSEGPAMSIDTAEFTSLASQGEVVSQADAASAAASAAEHAEAASQADLASADDSASVASAGGRCAHAGFESSCTAGPVVRLGSG